MAMARVGTAAPRPVVSWLLAVALLVSPLLFMPWPDGAGYHDKQRLLQLGLAAVAGVGLVWTLVRDPAWLPQVSRPVACLLVAYFGLGAVSCVMALSGRHAWMEWSNLWLLLVLAWLVAQDIHRCGEAWLDRLLLINGLGCALYAVLAVTVCVMLLRTGQQPTSGLLIPGYDNHRFFSHTQTVSLPLLALLVARTQGRAPRWCWWLVGSLCWTLLCVAAGRGTCLGLLVGSAVLVGVWRNPTATRWCLSMWGMALAGGLTYLLLYVLLPQTLGLKPFGFLMEVVARSADAPTSGRWPLWEHALAMVVDHPWLGAGPMHYAHSARDLQLGAHPHNWVLQMASEWGVPATVCVVLALAWGLRTLWRMRRKVVASGPRDTCTLAAWLLIGTAVVVDGLVSGLVVMPASQLWLAMVLGCAWGWSSLYGSTLGAVPVGWHRPGWQWALLALAPLSVAALAVGVWPEVRDIRAHEQQALQAAGDGPPLTLRPRIWRAGFF